MPTISLCSSPKVEWRRLLIAFFYIKKEWIRPTGLKIPEVFAKNVGLKAIAKHLKLFLYQAILK